MLNNYGFPSKFFDIYDFRFVPFVKTKTFSVLFICLLVLTLAVIVFLIFYLIKKRKEIPLEPWQWAEAELSKFSVSKLKDKNDFKIFYYSLTHLLKKYFTKRFAWKLEDKTDEEIEVYLQDVGADLKIFEAFVVLLNSSVMVKFADEYALPVQAQKDLDIAKLIISQTTPSS